ncbi:sulfurtransferase TusA family protein [Veillonella magna]|uniref:Sulfurtransferase TusA family protein n=1 Tax=Veillonella magna TaxID=464322 RepID=A0ABS2GJA8_9FIRM|nr:sulfurtransferase TusA family protein [Veillonella magna]MBM6825039.1 sulfurtransferase TusA family protein [Veillonella magna]MBM6913333.1 sulfurtransferase TusA family protein [Veillonella magna]
MAQVVTIDTKGLDCPIPLMKMKEALEPLQAGDIVEVEFTCPEATVNLPNYCQEHGHDVVSFEKLKTGWKIVVRK